MPITQEQGRLRAYYAHVVEHRVDDDEGVMRPPAARFRQLLDQLPPEARRTALDLGYGFGGYTLALASAGFRVDAVDIIPARHLRTRLAMEAADILERVTIHETDLRDFAPRSQYGFVVAKDVLHFLDKPAVARLLGTTSARTEGNTCHYITIFADIARTDRDGQRVAFNGEAGFSKAEWVDMIEAIYGGWALTWEWAERVQRQPSNGRPYFRATQATFVAVKP